MGSIKQTDLGQIKWLMRKTTFLYIPFLNINTCLSVTPISDPAHLHLQPISSQCLSAGPVWFCVPRFASSPWNLISLPAPQRMSCFSFDSCLSTTELSVSVSSCCVDAFVSGPAPNLQLCNDMQLRRLNTYPLSTVTAGSEDPLRARVAGGSLERREWRGWMKTKKKI